MIEIASRHRQRLRPCACSEENRSAPLRLPRRDKAPIPNTQPTPRFVSSALGQRWVGCVLIPPAALLGNLNCNLIRRKMAGQIPEQLALAAKHYLADDFSAPRRRAAELPF